MDAAKPAMSAPSGGISRRRFISTSLTASGGLLISMAIPPAIRASSVESAPPSQGASLEAGEVNAWIAVEPDDRVIIRIAKSELGEGVWTSLAMIVAEELGCDWETVRTEYASANRNLREGNVYHRMVTSSSSSVRQSREFLQQAGASARVRLIAVAARRWQVPPESCDVVRGQVFHRPSGRSSGFGRLAADAALVKIDAEPAIKKPDQFTLIGTSRRRLDTPVKVNGQAVYGIDVKIPGMVYAAVAMCPVPGGTMKAFDAKAIEGQRGILSVVSLPTGVAVVADRFWRAKQAVDVLPVEWELGAGAGSNSAQLRQDYRAALAGPLVNAKRVGDVEGALAGAKVIAASYEAPHLAHAPMEPLNCTVHVRPDRVDLWLGTQAPDTVLQLAAKTLGVPPASVYVHNCFVGGGFGRRSTPDEVVQAVLVAKAVGLPVKLIWTRENDMRHDRYRPQAAVGLRATLGADGMPRALDVRVAVGSLQRSLGTDPVKSGVESSAVDGFTNHPYAIPNVNVDCILKNTHVPVMYWRSVGYSQNTFFMESFIDELAAAAGQDPYHYRRTLLAGRPELLAVLDMLADKSGWDEKMAEGKGRGIAIQETNDTIVGEVVEVAIAGSGDIKVERIVAVVDCGHLINPQIAVTQIESAIIYGLTAALYNEITIKDGQVEQGNFDTYRMVKLADVPKIETHFALSGGTRWGGLGEPATPPVAPALCSAIFAVTGRRIRSLPLNRSGVY